MCCVTWRGGVPACNKAEFMEMFFVSEYLHERGETVDGSRRVSADRRVQRWRNILGGTRVGESRDELRGSRRAETPASRPCRSLLQPRERGKSLIFSLQQLFSLALETNPVFVIGVLMYSSYVNVLMLLCFYSRLVCHIIAWLPGVFGWS